MRKLTVKEEVNNIEVNELILLPNTIMMGMGGEVLLLFGVLESLEIRMAVV